MKTTLCIADVCNRKDERLPAKWLAPQSVDGGATVAEMVPVCDYHREVWWDGADWDGRHLERPIEEH